MTVVVRRNGDVVNDGRRIGRVERQVRSWGRRTWVQWEATNEAGRSITVTPTRTLAVERLVAHEAARQAEA